MGFAAPLALLFLGLFIPVILLYLLKQRRRRVELPTLMFWDQILRDEQTVTSLTRLKKLLSLLLQLAFIALLTFALARPLLSGKWTGARRIVLFLDVSASMLVNETGETRFQQALGKARSVIRGMSIGDSLMLVTVGASPDIAHVFTDSRKDLLDALGKIEPTHGQADFKQAIKLLEQLPPDERQTDVYLVTDGAFAPVEVPALNKTRFAYLKVGAATDNVGITSFQVRPMPASPRDFQIHAEIVNQTEQERTFPVELRIGGSLVDAFEFTIPARGSVTKNLKQYSAQGGEVELVADFADAFPLDNHAYAVLPPPRLVRVALVTESDLFLERALATDDGVELSLIKPADFKPDSGHDVTIFSGWHPPEGSPGNAIYILNWPEDLGAPRRGIIEKPLVTEWDRSHPVNRHLALQDISIEKAVDVEKSDRFTVLASSFENPLVLLNEAETRKTLLVAFDPNTSDLPLRIAFPIMIANAVRYLSDSNPGEQWANAAIGSILSAQDLAKYLPRDTTNALERVEGPLAQKFPFTNAAALLPVNRAGIFYAVSGDSREPLFAANLASKAESAIKPGDTLPLKSAQKLAEIKDGLRLGLEPWFVLAAIAMVLTTVEWGLFHRRVIE